MKILLIEVCNYDDYPIGGYLSFAKQMLSAFGSELSLVGLTTDNTPVGCWVKKKINGIEYDFFSVRRVNITSKKTLIPVRLKSFFAVIKYRKKIFETNFRNVFIQTPEVLFALAGYNNLNLCTRIPGVENPLSVSRYWYSKYFASIFDYFFFRSLTKSNLILASADKNAINKFLLRGKSILPTDKIRQFPTRIDTSIFKPESKLNCRFELGLDPSIKIIATTGRLSELKGWKFMIDSFQIFNKKYSNSLFIFIGDGEDRLKVENYIENKDLSKNVVITGRLNHHKLALYLNSADVYIMGSFVEGWATSLVEAIACAKPVVCTKFSSADELVVNGFNGFIIDNRDEMYFSDSIISALSLSNENLLSQSKLMSNYSTLNLKQDILDNWNII